MQICGVIVEYNPFHNGHRYHVQQARQQTGAEAVVAVMSGNFLQRGEPAVMDKWSRAQAALANGVDLVIELPFAWAVQSADYFARGAVKILQQVGCQALCFGSDSQASFDYQHFGSFAAQQQEAIEEAFRQLADSALSYPQKMTTVFREIYPDSQLDFSSPNHILGLSYAKENARYPQPMQLVPIARTQAAYHDQEANHATIASATAIRKLLLAGESAAQLMPLQSQAGLAETVLIDWEQLWPYLKYKLLTTEAEQLQGLYQMKEGLEYRFKQAVLAAESFAELMTFMKTKRYTWVRLQRLCLYILGNVTPAEIQQAQADQKLRVLGYTETGRRLLKASRGLPWISRFAKQEAAAWQLNVKMDRLYQMLDPQIQEQNFGRRPLLG